YTTDFSGIAPVEVDRKAYKAPGEHAGQVTRPVKGMIAGRRSKTVAFVATLALAMFGALVLGANVGQSDDNLAAAFEVAQGASQSAAEAAIQEMSTGSALAYVKPLTAEEVQNLLGANEALVFFLVGANESYVFALTREGFEWRTISLGEENVSARVAAFRRGLDVDGLTKSVDARKPELFDLATAHEFYLALLGPVEALIKDKPRLLIVPTGPLTALPFHLLVTDKPATRERVCFAQKPARACVLCMIGAPWSVDLQPKRLDHRRPESN